MSCLITPFGIRCGSVDRSENRSGDFITNVNGVKPVDRLAETGIQLRQSLDLSVRRSKPRCGEQHVDRFHSMIVHPRRLAVLKSGIETTRLVMDRRWFDSLRFAAGRMLILWPYLFGRSPNIDANEGVRRGPLRRSSQWILARFL